MTVAELIVKLQSQDPSATVLVYAGISEDADYAGRVLAFRSEDLQSPTGSGSGRPYVKGDWPDFGERGPVVVIG